MAKVNCMSLQLLQEGWTKDQTPPGCRGPWKDYYGGWEYTGTAMAAMTFETPCGLLASGSHWVSGHMSYMGMEWTVENGNPTLTCPHFRPEPCPLNHPLLQGAPAGHGGQEHLTFCSCHRTQRPYTYAGGVDEAHDQVWNEANRLFEEFDRAHGGRACKMQSRYNRSTRKWHMSYDPRECARLGACRWCKVLQKELDPKKGNVFFDLRATWTTAGEGLFPDESHTKITKGIKLLEKPASLTPCQAIANCARHRVSADYRLNRHSDLYYNKSLRLELMNFRAARMDVRDLLQDLQDVQAGIAVEHQADSLKAVKEQKRKRQEAAQARKIRKWERLILEQGSEGLTGYRLQQAEKLLGEDRVEALLCERQRPKLKEDEPEQLSFLL